MKLPCHLLPVVCLLTFACSDGSAPQSPEDTGPTESTEYYEVNADGLWEGSWEFTSHMAARRILQPSESTIHEQFVDLDEGDIHEVTLDVDLDTSTFTLTYEDGSYEGTGVLHGDAWDWHAWESTSIAPDGSSVVSEDTMDENGIIANKTGYDADGQEQWTMLEVLTPITEEQWEALQEDSE